MDCASRSEASPSSCRTQARRRVVRRVPVRPAVEMLAFALVLGCTEAPAPEPSQGTRPSTVTEADPASSPRPSTVREPETVNRPEASRCTRVATTFGCREDEVQLEREVQERRGTSSSTRAGSCSSIVTVSYTASASDRVLRFAVSSTISERSASRSTPRARSSGTAMLRACRATTTSISRGGPPNAAFAGSCEQRTPETRLTPRRSNTRQQPPILLSSASRSIRRCRNERTVTSDRGETRQQTKFSRSPRRPGIRSHRIGPAIAKRRRSEARQQTTPLHSPPLPLNSSKRTNAPSAPELPLEAGAPLRGGDLEVEALGGFGDQAVVRHARGRLGDLDL